MTPATFAKGLNRLRLKMAPCAAGLIAASLCGCGGHGAERFAISGAVTYDGAPVPGGRIVFAPAQGVSGPGAVAEIENGRYATRRGHGATAGLHRVTVYGTDGTEPTQTRDNSLFPPYRLEVELSAEQPRQDFHIPKQRPATGAP